MMQTFPLLALSLVVYSLLSLVLGGDAWYDVEACSIGLMSGDLWRISWGHMFLSFSMMLLFIELLRSTRGGGATTMNNAFSVGVFIIALLLFIMGRGYGNSTFFIFMGMTFLDFMAGFIITTATARRDLAFTSSRE